VVNESTGLSSRDVKEPKLPKPRRRPHPELAVPRRSRSWLKEGSELTNLADNQDRHCGLSRWVVESECPTDNSAGAFGCAGTAVRIDSSSVVSQALGIVAVAFAVLGGGRPGFRRFRQPARGRRPALSRLEVAPRVLTADRQVLPPTNPRAALSSSTHSNTIAPLGWDNGQNNRGGARVVNKSRESAAG
jgi:hypothetical protein